MNPLVQDGKKLIPSVTRVFNANHEMYVFLQAYKPPPTQGVTPTTEPLMAFVSLYSGGAEVFRTPPLAVTPDAATRLGVTPLIFDLGLNKLQPGPYDCQVTVLDPATAKANFWRAPIVIAR